MSTPPPFDPEILTLGFARRVATYKRLEMLTRDPDWTIRLLDGDRPVQVVLAGKAHPRDEEAKRALQSVFGLKAAKIVGAIGVIGPTRINYARIIPMVDYTAKMIGRLIG